MSQHHHLSEYGGKETKMNNGALSYRRRIAEQNNKNVDDRGGSESKGRSSQGNTPYTRKRIKERNKERARLLDLPSRHYS